MPAIAAAARARGQPQRPAAPGSAALGTHRDSTRALKCGRGLGRITEDARLGRGQHPRDGTQLDHLAASAGAGGEVLLEAGDQRGLQLAQHVVADPLPVRQVRVGRHRPPFNEPTSPLESSSATRNALSAYEIALFSGKTSSRDGYARGADVVDIAIPLNQL